MGEFGQQLSVANDGFGGKLPADHLPMNMTRPTLLLVLLGATFLLDGIVGAFVTPQSEASATVIHGIAIAMICYAWTRADATARGIVTPGRSALYAGLLPLLGVPAYLFRTRGTGKGAIASVKAFALVVGLLLLDGSAHFGIAALRA